MMPSLWKYFKTLGMVSRYYITFWDYSVTAIEGVEVWQSEIVP
jgi:hypothetical protein